MDEIKRRNRNNKSNGRRIENMVVKELGGMRIGSLGGEDIMHEKFSIECKHRQKFVGNGFMEQCDRNNKFNRIPLVVVHTHNQRIEDSLVMVKMKDFKSLIGVKDE